MLTVTTIKLKNINDKELLYIVIYKDGKKANINVGKSTYDKVREILGETDMEEKGIDEIVGNKEEVPRGTEEGKTSFDGLTGYAKTIKK